MRAKVVHGRDKAGGKNGRPSVGGRVTEQSQENWIGVVEDICAGGGAALLILSSLAPKPPLSTNAVRRAHVWRVNLRRQ
jgi:hypothetical protein